MVCLPNSAASDKFCCYWAATLTLLFAEMPVCYALMIYVCLATTGVKCLDVRVVRPCSSRGGRADQHYIQSPGKPRTFAVTILNPLSPAKRSKSCNQSSFSEGIRFKPRVVWEPAICDRSFRTCKSSSTSRWHAVEWSVD